MRRKWALAPFCVLFLVGASQAVAQGVGVALVTGVSGETLVRSSRQAHAAQVLEWLPEGARLETRGEGRLRLVLRNGRRYELAGEARAVVGREALRSAKGARALVPLRAWPTELLAPTPGSGTSGAAVRIRANDLKVVGPRAGGWVLGDQALEVRFERPAGATSCDVEIQGRDGSLVGRPERADGDRAIVPAAALREGESYHCVVTCQLGQRSVARGAAGFRTLSAESARLRRELLAAAQQGGDADAALSAASLEHELGRNAQARARLLEARAQQPGDANLRVAVELAEDWR